MVREQYQLLEGETEEESTMVDFFKQENSAYSRSVTSSPVTGVMVSRHCGTGHLPTDTSVTTIAKIMRQMTAWMHPDHSSTFINMPKDHHGILHNGLLVMTEALAREDALLPDLFMKSLAGSFNEGMVRCLMYIG